MFPRSHGGVQGQGRGDIGGGLCRAFAGALIAWHIQSPPGLQVYGVGGNALGQWFRRGRNRVAGVSSSQQALSGRLHGSWLRKSQADSGDLKEPPMVAPGPDL
ncbi:hypothetical protein VULLAG_LOCUS6964 [Vulpes lagopus]